MLRPRSLLAALAGTLLTAGAHAAPIIDPAGDFLSTYTGPRGGDLDVLSAEVRLDGNSFSFILNDERHNRARRPAASTCWA